MSTKDKQPPKELKVTDKRIFTADGEIRDEFKQEITPADPQPPRPPDPPPPPPQEAAREAKPAADRRAPQGEDRRNSRSVADKAASPATPFADFLEGLIMQAYVSLGMLRNPYQPQTKIDAGAARQMIEILTLLREKTAGNLTADEEDFLETHLGELKLAYVQRTKSI
ncbi:MAG TPA: DUF1844 domain-containing protein [Thermoanaerobaculia bacterium]